MLPLSAAKINVLNEQQFERLFQFAQKVENMLNPLVPRAILEGHKFFSKFWRRIEGGRN